MRKKIWMVSPLFYFMAAAMFLISIAMYRYNKVLFAIEITVSGLAIISVLVSDIIFRRNISSSFKIAKRVLTVEEEHALEAFPLPVAVAAPLGDIVWANKAFVGKLCLGKDYMGDNILKYIYPKTLRQIMGERGTPVVHEKRAYTVYGTKASKSTILYFVDDTYYKEIHKQFREQRSVVCIAAFDNREELIRDNMAGEGSRITADVDAVMRNWVINELGGFIKKLEGGRYLFVTDENHLEAAKQRKFKVLDHVREIKNASKMSATVSIGIGREAPSVEDSERWANQALDMALGRGGDQVAIMQGGDDYEFFGGTSKGVEKRDKVRTRVIAATLTDNVKLSDKVFIMGHKNSDLDSVGAAVGLLAAFKKGLGIDTKIVINRATTLADGLVREVEAAYEGESVFIAPQQAMLEATDKSLLIIVDTHSVNLVESGDVLDKISRVVVIDHHRMMVSHIKDAIIFYHEPYASSAAEMVAELVQYIKSTAIDAIDAQALLSGIMLDTKNFVLKTGVRTFEASAYLRRRGADTVAVKKLFSNTLDSYKQKSQLVSGAEIYKGCAVATSIWDSQDLRVASAQAADELLSIQGVASSFVLYKSGSDVNISARSLGNVNVQLILEPFGGGGHFTMAGAQIKGKTIGDVRKSLLKEIDKSIGEKDNKNIN